MKRLRKKLWPEAPLETAVSETPYKSLKWDMPWRDKIALANLKPSQRPRLCVAINIPVKLKSQSVWNYRMTARLRHLLNNLNVRTLGDLDGVQYASILGCRQCGALTIEELKMLIEKIQRAGRRQAAAQPQHPTDENNPRF